jgi:DNA-binding NarL/FixJ family response regulator
MENIINIGILEDHAVVRTALANLINYQDNFNMLLEAGTYEELSIKMKSGLIPHVILMDYNLPDKMGPECVAEIRKNYSHDIKILGLSTYKEEHIIKQMLEAGANGFLVKEAEFDELNRAITQVQDRGFFFNDHVGKMMLKNLQGQEENKSKDELNANEIAILKLICDQKTNAQIADELCLSKHTVNSYRNKLLEKTDSMNTAGLVIYAVKQGYVLLD